MNYQVTIKNIPEKAAKGKIDNTRTDVQEMSAVTFAKFKQESDVDKKLLNGYVKKRDLYFSFFLPNDRESIDTFTPEQLKLLSKELHTQKARNRIEAMLFTKICRHNAEVQTLASLREHFRVAQDQSNYG